MPGRLKAYSMNYDGRYRHVVAAANLKAAAALIGTTVGHLRSYGGALPDCPSATLALAEPGVVFRSRMGQYPERWERVG